MVENFLTPYENGDEPTRGKKERNEKKLPGQTLQQVNPAQPA